MSYNTALVHVCRAAKRKTLYVMLHYSHGTAASLGVRGPERYFRVCYLTRGGRVVWIVRLVALVHIWDEAQEDPSSETLCDNA